jgi:putative Holliday junction resolvase
MKRIMALDVGDKTIGVAVSDPLGLTAQGITTIKRKGMKNDIRELIELINEYNIELLVIGLPKNMNNTIGPQGEKVLKFTDKLKELLDIEMVLQDERLTTVSAEKMLINSNVRREKRKKVVDMIAATYILQTYLEKQNRR